MDLEELIEMLIHLKERCEGNMPDIYFIDINDKFNLVRNVHIDEDDDIILGP